MLTKLWAAQLVSLQQSPWSSLHHPEIQRAGPQLPGASVRNSAHGKGHEEGGSAYARRDRASGVSLDTLEHLPPKPEFAYFTTDYMLPF